ncbi:MAG: hypothetical protein AAFQ95_21530 [Cyanobacteria bacterium J06621_3]
MSVSGQTVLLMLLAGVAGQVTAYLLNGLPPIQEFPGKNGLSLRMTALFMLVPLLVSLLTDTDEQGVLVIVGQARIVCWIGVGGVAAALLYDVIQLVKSLRKAKIRESHGEPEPLSYAPQIRKDLLAEAQRQVRLRLKYAYGDQALINLVMESQDDKVSGAEIDGDVFLVPKPKQQIESLKDGRIRLAESEQTILQTFDDDDIAGQLLILGAPGSGKTTALLTLAESLLVRAEDSVDDSLYL